MNDYLKLGIFKYISTEILHVQVFVNQPEVDLFTRKKSLGSSHWHKHKFKQQMLSFNYCKAKNPVVA
jgi:hypothetical protein